jgi:hypothetical protein
MRGVFVNGRSDFELTMAGMLRPILEFGITPDLRLLSIGSPSPFHLSNQVFATLRAGRGGSPPLDVTMPLDDIVAAAGADQPEVITSYPSILGLLAEEQLDGRLRRPSRRISARRLRRRATIPPTAIPLVLTYR